MEDITAKIASLLDNDDAMKQMASILSSLNTPAEPESRAGVAQQGGGPDLGVLASLLGGLGNTRQEPPRPGPEPPPQGGGLDIGALLGALGGAGARPQGGGDLGALAGLLGGLGGGQGSGGSRQSPPGEGGTSGFDPRLMGILTRAMGAMGESDQNIQLLAALRPYLEGRRREKTDEAIKMLRLLKLVPLLQESGIFSQSQS